MRLPWLSRLWGGCRGSGGLLALGRSHSHTLHRAHLCLQAQMQMCVNLHLLIVCILNKWVSGSLCTVEGHPALGPAARSCPRMPSHPASPSLCCHMPEVPEEESLKPSLQPRGSPLEPCVLWECHGEVSGDSRCRRCAACVSKITGARVVVGMSCTRNMEVGLVNMEQHPGYS